MGPSGSGKSTLTNIIGALDTPSACTYILNGTDVSHLTDDRLAEIRNMEIGFVFQTFNLLHQYSALENVILPLVYAGVPKHERIERGKQALERVGLAERMLHKPNELSGGQRQRVAVAEPSSTIRPSFWPTNPPVTSTQRPPSTLCGFLPTSTREATPLYWLPTKKILPYTHTGYCACEMAKLNGTNATRT